MTRRYLPNSPFKAPPAVEVEHYAVGDRVIHDAYGVGKVTAVEGTFAVQVDFTPQVIRITLPCTKMTAL